MQRTTHARPLRNSTVPVGIRVSVNYSLWTASEMLSRQIERFMAIAAKTVGEAMPVYDAVVIGSGYGAGVAASRLARMGCAWRSSSRGGIGGPRFSDNGKGAPQGNTVTGRAPKLGDPAGLYYLFGRQGTDRVRRVRLRRWSLINAGVVLRPDLGRLREAGWPDAVVSDGPLLGPRAGRGNARRRVGARSGALCQVCRYAQGGRSVRPLAALAADDDLRQAGTERGRRDAVRLPVSGTAGRVATSAQEHRWNHIHRRCGRSRRNGALRKPAQSISKTESGWEIVVQDLFEGERKPTHRGADSRPRGRHTGDHGAAVAAQQRGLELSAKLGEKFSANGDDLVIASNLTSQSMPLPRGFHLRRRGGPRRSGRTHGADRPGDEHGPVWAHDGTMLTMMAALAPLNDLLQLKIGGALQLLKQGIYGDELSRSQLIYVVAHDDASGRLRLQNDHVIVDWPGYSDAPERVEQSRRSRR